LTSNTLSPTRASGLDACDLDFIEGLAHDPEGAMESPQELRVRYGLG
jgi:hypothetical protein